MKDKYCFTFFSVLESRRFDAQAAILPFIVFPLTCRTIKTKVYVFYLRILTLMITNWNEQVFVIKNHYYFFSTVFFRGWQFITGSAKTQKVNKF